MKLLVSPYFNFSKLTAIIDKFSKKDTPINIKVDQDLLFRKEGDSLE